MRNTKNSKEAQGVGTAQELQEQFNIATQDLFFQFDINTIKENWELTITSWIGSDYFESYNGLQRSNIFSFNLELIKYFETISSILEKSENQQIDFLIFKPLFDARDYKSSREHLNEVFTTFLMSDESDDLLARQDAILLNKAIIKYLKKVFLLCEMLYSKNVA